MLKKEYQPAIGLTVPNKTIREKFLQYYPDEDLKKWFDPLELSCPENAAFCATRPGPADAAGCFQSGQNIRVNFPHPLFAAWFKSNFQNKFELALAHCLGTSTKISYACPGLGRAGNLAINPAPWLNALSAAGTERTARLMDRAEPGSGEVKAPGPERQGDFGADMAPSPVLFTDNPEVMPTWATEDEIPAPDTFEESDDYAENHRQKSFANFLYNRKNQFPVAAAQKFATGNWNLLFVLTGESGNGKSHLLQAIYNELSLNVPKKQIFFKSLDHLATFFANTLKNSQSPLSYFRQFKYIILDDLDGAAAKPELQEQLAKLLEYAHERRIACAISLQKLGSSAFLNQKLHSLLEGGLVIELKKPDLDIRRQYVDNCCNVLNLQIKKDDALTLARMYSGFRQIYGVMLKVAEFKVLSAQAAEAKLTDILQSSLPGGGFRLTPEHIIATAAEYLGVPTADVTGKIRRRSAVLARHIAMYLCRELLGSQLGHIGACFSDRDHSSVLYSVNKIKQMSQSDEDMHILVTEVKNRCLK